MSAVAFWLIPIHAVWFFIVMAYRTRRGEIAARDSMNGVYHTYVAALLVVLALK